MMLNDENNHFHMDFISLYLKKKYIKKDFSQSIYFY